MNISDNIKQKRNNNSSLFIFISNLKHIVSLFKDYKLKLSLATIFALGATAFSVISPKIVASATNELFYGLKDKIDGVGQINFENLLYFLGMAVVMYILGTFCSCFQNIISTNISRKVCYELRKKLVHKINCLPISYFEHNSKGNLMSRVINDVDVLAQNISNILINFITSITMIIGCIIMMYSINWLLATTVIILIPVSILIVMLLISFSQKHFINQQNILGEVNAYTEEHIAGHSIIEIFNKQNDTIEEFSKINQRLYKESTKARIISQTASPLFSLIINVSYIIVVIFGALLSIVGQLTVGGIIAFVQYTNNFTNPLYSLISISNLIQQMAASSMRIEEFLNLKEEKDVEKKCCNDILKKYDSNKPIIQFKNVSFGYEKNIKILDNISFKVYNGQTLAIIGPTGAGKTTIAKLLMRFYDIESGAIELYGKNIKDINRNEVREHISMVLQDIWLFNDTVKENIQYGNEDASYEDIVHASKIACIDDFIVKLKEKYNSIISQRAKNFSLGQKQLISIARAIVADREIMILDEATSSVDTKTEKKLYSALNNVIKNKTSIVIAHRLSTIKKADIILVINNGKIIEKGNHQELMGNKGFYYELYQSAKH